MKMSFDRCHLIVSLRSYGVWPLTENTKIKRQKRSMSVELVVGPLQPL